MAIENRCSEVADFAKLDAINDDLHSIARLMGKPNVMMAAPEPLSRSGVPDAATG